MDKMDIYQQKKELRKKVKLLKQEFSMEEKKQLGNAIFKTLESLSVFQKATVIMAYWSMDDEVYTHEFIQKWSQEKRIILPVVKGDELELKEFTGVEQMEPGEQFGIPEPVGFLFKALEEIDLILVPGVAFDKNNNRMGRGKAYYDKLLRNSNAYKIGLAFHFQIFEEIPFDELDVKMDLVISEGK